jgi:hypothetical protein
VRANVTIDWTLRENVRAQLRVLVKRILRKHGYPPDKQEKATQTVLEQAGCLPTSQRKPKPSSPRKWSAWGIGCYASCSLAAGPAAKPVPTATGTYSSVGGRGALNCPKTLKPL